MSLTWGSRGWVHVGDGVDLGGAVTPDLHHPRVTVLLLLAEHDQDSNGDYRHHTAHHDPSDAATVSVKRS